VPILRYQAVFGAYMQRIARGLKYAV